MRDYRALRVDLRATHLHRYTFCYETREVRRTATTPIIKKMTV